MIFTLPVLAYLPEVMGANKRLDFLKGGVSSFRERTVIKAILINLKKNETSKKMACSGMLDWATFATTVPHLES